MAAVVPDTAIELQPHSGGSQRKSDDRHEQVASEIASASPSAVRRVRNGLANPGQSTSEQAIPQGDAPTTQNDSGTRNTASIPPPQRRHETKIVITNTTMTVIALVIAIVFGTGAWIGQAWGNHYSEKSYQVSLYGLCADHEVRSSEDSNARRESANICQSIQNHDICRKALEGGPANLGRRDLRGWSGDLGLRTGYSLTGWLEPRIQRRLGIMTIFRWISQNDIRTALSVNVLIAIATCFFLYTCCHFPYITRILRAYILFWIVTLFIFGYLHISLGRPRMEIGLCESGCTATCV